MSEEPLPAAVAAALTEATGTELAPADVTECVRLSAGANRRTHRAEVAGIGTVVVQVERPGASHGLPGEQQAALLRRAGAVGIPVPAVLASGSHDAGPLAGHWTITAHVPGASVPRVVLRGLDDAGRRELLAQVSAAAAAVHRLPQGDLSVVDDLLGQVAGWFAATGPPPPAVTLAVRWLELHRPPPGPRGVVHGDLRLGNLLVEPDRPRLTAVLDWELAHVGAVHADLGWLCGRAWRFGSPHAAAGLGTRDELLAAYAAAGGDPPTSAALRWWELVGCVRWAAMCRIMGAEAARRDPPALEPAMVGRRVAEAAFDCLRLLPGGVESGTPLVGGAGVDEPPLAPTAPAGSGSGRDLLAAAAAELDRQVEAGGAGQSWQARIAANAVRTAARQWWLASRNRQRHAQRLAALGVADDDELRQQIAAGDHDDDVAGLALVLAGSARDGLAVVHPSWVTDP